MVLGVEMFWTRRWCHRLDPVEEAVARRLSGQPSREWRIVGSTRRRLGKSLRVASAAWKSANEVEKEAFVPCGGITKYRREVRILVAHKSILDELWLPYWLAKYCTLQQIKVFEIRFAESTETCDEAI